MRVSTVTRNGRPLAFTHGADRSRYHARRAARRRRRRSNSWCATPASRRTACRSSRTSTAIARFFSDDWPNKAHQWLPTIDHISDKATMEMDVIAPSHYQVISNGRRVEETDLPGGMRRTVWRESVPIAPWLYVLGVARFAVQHVGDYHGVPLETWVLGAGPRRGLPRLRRARRRMWWRSTASGSDRIRTRSSPTCSRTR